jgi:hypothetical protein
MLRRRRDRNTGTPACKGLAASSGLALLALLALPGCSGRTDPAEALLACPRVGIVRDVAEITQFRPGGRGQPDVEARGALTKGEGDCEYGSGGVTVNASVLLKAERGPALKGNTATFRYFVAIVAPGQNEPSAKSEFETVVEFKPGQTTAGSREELAQKIPLPKNANAKDWGVFFGFQLTPEQLDYNRALLKR